MIKSFRAHLEENKDNSLTAHHSKMVSAGYERGGSLRHATNGKSVHVYRKKGSKSTKDDVHVHVQHGVVGKVAHNQNTDYVALKKGLDESTVAAALGAYRKTAPRPADPERAARIKAAMDKGADELHSKVKAAQDRSHAAASPKKEELQRLKVAEGLDEGKDAHDKKVADALSRIEKKGGVRSTRLWHSDSETHHKTSFYYMPKKEANKGGGEEEVHIRTLKNEEKEAPKGKSLLKEKPPKDDEPKKDADKSSGKFGKSKSYEKVKDCIKMSGKKEKIDTEPVLNNLTTTANYNL